MSEGIPALNAALAKAQAEFPAIKREKTVSTGSYSYSYASLDVILDAVRKPLSDNGLALVQMLEDDGIRTELRHAEGGVIGAKFPLPTVPAKPQELGSLLTYLRRYAVVAILGIAPEEDDDGGAAQHGAEKSAGEEGKTPAQNKKIFALIGDLEKLKLRPPQPYGDWKTVVEARCQRDFGKPLSEITKTDASMLIDGLSAYVQGVIENPPDESGFQAPTEQGEPVPF